MYSSFNSQIQGFAISIIVGVLLGAFYDIFRIYRTVLRPEKRAVFFQDLFYMVCAAFVTFLLSLGVSYGEVRFYILCGEIIGCCLYFLTVGMVTIQVFRFVTNVLHKYLIYPVKRVFRKFFRWIHRRIEILCKNIKIAAGNQRKRLKERRQIVYNQNNSKPIGKKKKKSPKGRKTAKRRGPVLKNESHQTKKT